jgi:hypothetical protein
MLLKNKTQIQDIMKKVRSSVPAPQFTFEKRLAKEIYRKDQKFIMHAVADGGKQLWRSFMIERQRFLTELGSYLVYLPTKLD